MLVRNGNGNSSEQPELGIINFNGWMEICNRREVRFNMRNGRVVVVVVVLGSSC